MFTKKNNQLRKLILQIYINIQNPSIMENIIILFRIYLKFNFMKKLLLKLYNNKNVTGYLH